MATELHTYQCWACKSTMTTPIKSAGTGHPYRCLNDQTPMSYLFSMPIATDEDRALAARGMVFNAAAVLEQTPNTKRACDTCQKWVEKADMITLGAGGKYCSESCANVGTERHRAVMARVEKLYEQQPWLRPAIKETA